MKPIDRVLEKLSDVISRNEGWTALCPAHSDHQRSLSIGVGLDGRILLHCFAGCSLEQIIRALKLSAADVKGLGASETAKGCTLTDYSLAKRLPEEFLRSLGVTDIFFSSTRVLRVPYFQEDHSLAAVRFRTSLEGESRFRWKKGDKPIPYGLWRLHEARLAGHVVLVEGESDAQTLWFNGVPALGLPGAASWQRDWAALLDDIAVIYVFRESDAGGRAMDKWLSMSEIRNRAFIVQLDSAKDPSDLHISDPGTFLVNWAKALEKATPWSKIEGDRAYAQTKEAWRNCSDLACDHQILQRFVEALRTRNVAGEEDTAQLIYLALTSRVLNRPISLAIKGPSSGGKSFLVENVLSFFPPEAYYALSAMSDKSLAYSDEPLQHRFIVLYEAVGLVGDFANYLMRSLLSEGRVRYETVEKSAEGRLGKRLIERVGPTGLLLTTTRTQLHPENETRLLSLTVNDTREQTQAVLMSLANSDAENRKPDNNRWIALQRYLQGANHKVRVPYAEELAELTPPIAPRLRRDFTVVLNLIRAHAILQQVSRRIDSEGRILANFYDYSVVRNLVTHVIAEGVDSSVSGRVRQTVQAVQTLLAKGIPEVSLQQVAEVLGQSRSSMSRRTKEAIGKGFLKNLETTSGRPVRLVMGDPLPLQDDQEFLPTPEALIERCRVAGGMEELFTPPPLLH